MNATSGPVSTMAARIAAEACEVVGVGGEIGNSRIHHTARALHERGKVWARIRPAWSFENETQSLLDQVLELAAAQGGLRLGPAVEVVRHFDRGLHPSAP